ncbi:hypothetical protein [Vulgatibacter sp.]|uniref:hypothetical protein n=1 Tax=Vulgatibacter sp. TaxID=1971226 RepID=UPI00356A158E
MRRLVALLAVGQLLIACAEEEQRPEVEAAVRLHLEAPSDGLLVEARDVVVRGHVEADGPLARIAYLVNGQEQRSDLPLSAYFDIEMKLVLREGPNVVAIVASDEAGNEARIERRVESTVRAPEIRAFTASVERVRPGAPVELAWVVEGTGPFDLTIDGIGTVEGDGITVRPGHTTTYRLEARTAFGVDTAVVDVQVQPELVPQLRVVAAGSTQKLAVAGTAGPVEYEVTGGRIEVPEYEAFWVAPEEPGRYEIRVEVEGSDDFVQEVEVRAIEPIAARWVGLAGMPATLLDSAPVVDEAGRLWAVGDAGVVTKPAGRGSWILRNDGLDLTPRAITLAPDGTLWLVGRDMQDYGCALATWDPVTEAWMRDPERQWGPDTNCNALTFGAGGSMVLREYGNGIRPVLWQRPGAGAAWERAPALPHWAGSLALAPDGTLYVATEEGSIVSRLPPGAASWESLGQTVAYATDIWLDPSGMPVVTGFGGLVRLAADDSWEDLSAGLPTECGNLSCWVQSLAFIGDRIVVAHDSHGLYARREGGAFETFAALPPGEELSWDDRKLVADGDGGFWVSGATGLWHLPAGESTYRYEGIGGLENPWRGASALATREDGSVAVGLVANQGPKPRPVALRTASGWQQVGPAERAPEDTPWGLLYEPDGSLLVATSAEIYRLAPDGSRLATLPAEGLPAERVSIELLREADGSLVLLAGAGKSFRLAPGAASWAALPELPGLGDLVVAPDGSLWGAGYGAHAGVLRLARGAAAWEPVGVSAVETALAGSFRSIAFTADGTAVAWTDQGVVRLEADGIWRRIGSGVCGWYLRGLLVTEGGTLYCTNEHSIFRFDAEMDAWVEIDGLPEVVWVERLFEGPNGALWVDMGTSGLFEVQLQ